MFRVRFANWKSSISRREVSAFTRNDRAVDDGIIERGAETDKEKENVDDPFLSFPFLPFRRVERERE